MYNKVLDYVKKHNMLDGCGHVVVGLSGGADSVCLLVVLHKMRALYGYKMTAVHVHHGIRGEEADRDMNFCQKICKDLGIDLVCRTYDVINMAKEEGLSTEEMGRIVRYNAFEELASKQDSRIAVAHHAGDRVETVLFNMTRGTGIKGLAGIRPVRDRVVRPLLSCGKDEILQYLANEGISFCEDSTNALDEYTRNRIRHNVVPALMDVNGAAEKNICAMAERMQEIDEYLGEVVNEIYSRDAVREQDGILLKNLSSNKPLIQKMLVIKAIDELTGSLKDVTDVHVEMVLNLTFGTPGAFLKLVNGVTVRLDSDGVFFYKEITNEDICIDIQVPSVVENFSFDKINWNNTEKIVNEVYTKCFDYDKIKFGLQLRTRRDGDYLVADKAGHRKKLNRYFIDEKIPGRKRDEVLLLADGNHIIWVVGGRISEEYKVTDNTMNVLIVKYGG